MSLDLSPGSRCFIDSNIFVYHFTQDSRYSAHCVPFFRRIMLRELIAYTTPLVVADALHKIMLAEVQSLFSQPKPLSFIQRRPNLIPQLTTYRAACEDMGRLGVEMLPVAFSDFHSASAITNHHQQLTNDACIIAVIQHHGLTHLVTNDDDFDNIPGIKPAKPR